MEPGRDEFTRATRAEPGCLWFEWARSLDDANEFVLIEAFRDDEAGRAHVGSEHFRRPMDTLPSVLMETPRVINATVPGDDWPLLSELAVPERGKP